MLGVETLLPTIAFILMTQILRIGTLNINGILTKGKFDLLKSFVYTNNLHLLFLQEVCSDEIETFWGYDTILNIGTEGRGCGVLIKQGLPYHSITRLPSGRGISFLSDEILYITSYAHSGSNRQKEREVFYNTDIVPLFTKFDNIIFGADMNCVLRATDTTGIFQPSQAFANLVQNMSLCDVWLAKRNDIIFTYKTNFVQSRLDRFYVTNNMIRQVTNITAVVASFSDHAGIILDF